MERKCLTFAGLEWVCWRSCTCRSPLFRICRGCVTSVRTKWGLRLLGELHVFAFLNLNLSAQTSHLHWLLINMRIAYKILLLTFKSNIGLSPTYLSDLLHTYVPVRTLRSSNQSLLELPHHVSSKFYGQRTFLYAAPLLWNNLPQPIRKADNVNIFKTMLKTHLFKLVYSWL